MASESKSLAPFELADTTGTQRRFPTGRPALLCFVKEDCPTCGLTMPLLDVLAGAFGRAIDVWAIGQDADGNRKLIERYALKLPVLDDSALRVSFEYGLDTVPTAYLADGVGNQIDTLVGF